MIHWVKTDIAIGKIKSTPIRYRQVQQRRKYLLLLFATDIYVCIYFRYLSFYFSTWSFKVSWIFSPLWRRANRINIHLDFFFRSIEWNRPKRRENVSLSQTMLIGNLRGSRTNEFTCINKSRRHTEEVDEERCPDNWSWTFCLRFLFASFSCKLIAAMF